MLPIASAGLPVAERALPDFRQYRGTGKRPIWPIRKHGQSQIWLTPNMANPWTHWWTDSVPLLHQATFPRLLLALILGACVGCRTAMASTGGGPAHQHTGMFRGRSI